MGRWQPDAQLRLEQAALDLFTEHGYERTTVADIAERAGLTQRTFFRYFTDKREVLFGGGHALQECMIDATAKASGDASALEAVAAGLGAGAKMLQERHTLARQRSVIVAANAELRERELIKLAAISGALAQALRGRGVKDPAATLTAEVGIAAFRVAFVAWVAPRNRQTLTTLIRKTLDHLPQPV